MINRFWQKDNFWVTLLILLFTYLYVTTLPQVNVGYSDSDQLLSVAYGGGVAHPPGYPLYMFILSIWTKISLIAGTPAFRGHLLSAVFSVGTLILIYQTIRYLLSNLTPAKVKQSTFNQQIIAFISTSILGTTPLFWTYSTVTEVFSFHLFLTTALIYRSMVAVVKQPTDKKFWIVSAVVLALAVSHHHTVILVFPLVLFALIKNIRHLTLHHWIQSVSVFATVVIAVYSIIWLQNNQAAAFSWQVEPGVRGLWRHVSRQEFAGVVTETGQVVNAYVPTIDPESIFNFLPQYLELTADQIGVLVMIVSLFGFYALTKFSRQVSFVLAICLILTGPFFSGILGWPEHFGSQANIQRLLLMGYIFWPIFFAFGLVFFVHRLNLGLSVLNIPTRKTLFIIYSVSLLFLINGLVRQYPQSNLRNFKFVSQTYSTVLTQLKPNALVACFTDTSCFALMYEQSVNGLRPDVLVLPRAYPLAAAQLEQIPNLKNFVYTQDPFRTFDYITWNIDKRPVYAVEISEYYYHLLGINEGFTYYVPYGIYGELTRVQPLEFPQSDFSLSNWILETPIPSHDRMRLYYLSNVIRSYQFNSVIQLRSDYRNQAREELNIAGNLDDYLRLQEPIETNFEGVRRSIESSNIDPRFAPGEEPIALAEFLSLIDEWKQKRRLDVAHKMAVGAIAVYPDSVEARLAVALTFKEYGLIESSMEEYLNVLILDPSNQTAQDALQDLHTLIQTPTTQRQVIL